MSRSLFIQRAPRAAAAALALTVSFMAAVAYADEGTRYPVRMDLNVGIRMRDGVKLSADIYRPDARGRFPVVLVRTPYIKSTARYAEKGKWWASRGYAFVVQDVRGRGDSDGAFYPLRYEAQDGFDTQSWAGTQPWSNGKVGTTGGSYLGWTQVYAAGLNNPHLAAMVPTVTAPDPDRNFPVQFGVVMLSAAPWLAGVDGRMRQDLSQLDLESAYASLPLIDFDRRLGRSLPAWRDWIDHIADDDYWEALSYQDRYLDSTVPALHVSGWYDDVLVGTTENFINMTTRARNSAARSRQHLLIGPWGHATNAGRQLGEIDFGPEAVIDFEGLQKRWFDRWLRGIDNGIDHEPPVRIFVMGANEWRSEAEWPLARTRYVKYFLRSGGRANSRYGDGVLSTDPPAAETPDRFRYDPADPVPYMTGLSGKQVGGPDDYRAVERRDDVLVYTGPLIQQPLEICGPLSVKLFAASSARDTDWTAKVLDVHPDGYAQRLNDGIVRARFRHPDRAMELLTPGKVEEYDIDVWSTCIELQPGHRLRLEISSSAFPKFDRNLNTGGALGRETKGVVAEQTVYHDESRASYLLLPVIPPGR